MSVLGPSIANYVRSNRALYNLVKPVANWYAQVAGYRQHGLRYDDLIDEESEVMQKVRRLPSTTPPNPPTPSQPAYCRRLSEDGADGRTIRPSPACPNATSTTARTACASPCNSRCCTRSSQKPTGPLPKTSVPTSLSLCVCDGGADEEETGRQDKRYLTPLVKEIEAENAERKKWDSATLQRGH